MVVTRKKTTEWSAWVWMVVAVLAGLFVLALTSMTAGTALPGNDEPPAAVPVLSSWDGVFYAGRYFGDEPFVQVGSEVEPETVVGTIEGMRRFRQHAGARGTIVEVLVQDSEAVQMGQPLFMVQVKPEPDGR